MSDIDGLDLLARFSYVTNHLQYCGPDGKSGVLYDFVTKHSGEKKQIESCIRKFEGLYPYLSAIAQKNKRDPLDFATAEAYWIGNSLLKNFNKDDMAAIISELQKRGLPKSIASSLKQDLPSGFVPHHSFNVFYVGVGRVTGSVKTTLTNMDMCRISDAIVKDIRKTSLIVSRRSLRIENKKIAFGALRKKKIPFDQSFLPDVKEGSVVATHWDFPCAMLSDEQQLNLRNYTQINLDRFNNLKR